MAAKTAHVPTRGTLPFPSVLHHSLVFTKLTSLKSPLETITYIGRYEQNPGCTVSVFLALYNMNLGRFRQLSDTYLFGLIFELAGKPDLSCWAIRCFCHAPTLSSLDHSDKQKTKLYVFNKLPDMKEF